MADRPGAGRVMGLRLKWGSALTKRIRRLGLTAGEGAGRGFHSPHEGPGGMAEWTNATVLKTVIPPGIVGSNPTPSAINRYKVRLLADCRGLSSPRFANGLLTELFFSELVVYLWLPCCPVPSGAQKFVSKLLAKRPGGSE